MSIEQDGIHELHGADRGAPANGVACVFALLVDQLEASGVMPAGRFQDVLGLVLSQSGIAEDSDDGRFLREVHGLLDVESRRTLTVIDGGR